MKNQMRILIIADVDDLHWRHGKGKADLLLSCGDVSDQYILEAAEAYACRTIFAVKGNHDSQESFVPPIVDLHLAVQSFNGIRFGGFSGAWKYKPRGHFLYEQCEVDKLIASFPEVDILLCHNSPRGIHDKEDGIHYGFEGLTHYISNAKPNLLIHGHQHVNAETQIGATRVIGVYGYKVLVP